MVVDQVGWMFSTTWIFEQTGGSRSEKWGHLNQPFASQVTTSLTTTDSVLGFVHIFLFDPQAIFCYSGDEDPQSIIISCSIHKKKTSHCGYQWWIMNLSLGFNHIICPTKVVIGIWMNPWKKKQSHSTTMTGGYTQFHMPQTWGWWLCGLWHWLSDFECLVLVGWVHFHNSHWEIRQTWGKYPWVI